MERKLFAKKASGSRIEPFSEKLQFRSSNVSKTGKRQKKTICFRKISSYLGQKQKLRAGVDRVQIHKC